MWKYFSAFFFSFLFITIQTHVYVVYFVLKLICEKYETIKAKVISKVGFHKWNIVNKNWVNNISSRKNASIWNAVEMVEIFFFFGINHREQSINRNWSLQCMLQLSIFNFWNEWKTEMETFFFTLTSTSHVILKFA